MNNKYTGSEINEAIILKSFNLDDKEINDNEKSLHWYKHINKKNYRNLQNDFENFRNNGLSGGLDDQHSNLWLKKNLDKILSYVNYDFLKKVAEVQNIGNSKNIIKYENFFVDTNLLNEISWLSSINKKTDIIKNAKIICEIGSGFGSLASKIKKINQFSKYILIDLPESNILSSFYLSKLFPKKVFLLNGVNDINNQDLEDIDFIILNPNTNFNNLSVDLFINTRSMQEMNLKNIAKYFNLVQKNISNNGYLININAYSKYTVGETVNLSEYNYDKNWNVIISDPTYLQDHIHLLVTKRDYKISNIFEELNNIRELEKKIVNKYPVMLLRKAKILKYNRLKLLFIYLIYYYKLFIIKLFKKK